MSVEPIKGVLSVYTNPLYGTLASELLRGYSAYNIAVMEGYEGTVDEWLESLIGPKGDKGDQGDPGLDGEQGPRGYTGETGPKGDKGEKGDKGDTGNGIYAVVLRADYTLSIYFTDGSVYNTPSIRGREGAVGPAGPVGPQGETGAKGDKGDTGDAGVGISSIVQNADHSLTINLDDGTSYTTDPVEALKGDTGDTGNGISSIVMKSDYTLQINMTNGTSYTTPSIRGVAGAKGDKGDKGDTGATGPQGPKGDPGALNFHICSQTEYDATTRVPTVHSPEDDTFYLVPSASVTSPDLFVEWIYVNNAWEMFGSATVDISGKADKVQNATSGNFASLDSNGNLADSGHSFSEINQELTSVKSDLNQTQSSVRTLQDSGAQIFESDATDVDLDITDEQGNVIVRFEDGHIRTKEFDSSNIPSQPSNGNVDAKSSDSNSDLVICDNFGNSIVEFKNGHVKTKNFDSSEVAQNVDDCVTIVRNISGTDYIKQFTYNASESTTQTIEQSFKQGDIILCHLSNIADDVTDYMYTKLVTYGYVDENGTQHSLGQDYGYNFAMFILPADASGIYGIFPSELQASGTYTFKFIVYKLSDYKRQPHVVTVGADGRRMFTSVREAMDSFHDNNEYNTYEIWVYPGTYNILSDFTNDEIMTEDFVGLWVKNGVRIVGKGHREQIILHGELDPNTYNLSKRNAISTLNMSGNCGLENITVTNQYLRYAVHDDHTSGYYANQTRIVENCKFLSTNAASGGISQAAYGAGGHNSKKLIIRNCDLGDRFIIHNTQHQYVPMTAIVENSFAQCVTLTDNNDPTFTAKTRIVFNNCNFDYVRHDRTTDGSDPTMILQGTGSHDIKLDCEAGTLYNFGDCRVFPGTISAGQAVKMSNSVSITATSSLDDIYGISIGNDGTHTYVQRRGYINNNILGLTGLSVGDYITIDSNGVCVSGGTASNAIGVVECIDAQTSTAFVKLLFK